MNTETRLVFGLKDLTSIKLICNDCGHEAACHISKAPKGPPRNCPWCGVDWKDFNPAAWDWLKEFVKRTLTQCRQETKYTVKFDMIQQDALPSGARGEQK